MVVSETQIALLILLVTGVIGARRGWGRELITCAIVLSTLLFLQLDGASVVTNLFASGLAVGASASAGGSASCGVGGTASSTSSSKTVSDLIFVGMVWLGYHMGNRHGSAAQSLMQRIVGVVAGLITGGVIAYYLNNALYSGAQWFLQGLSAVSFLASLPLLLGIGLATAIVFLLHSWQDSKSSKSSKG